MNDKPLPAGWRMTPLPVEKIQAYEKYVSDMAAQAAPRMKRVVPDTFNGKAIKDLTPLEQEDFYFSLQAKSTQEAITRQKTRKPEDDIDYLLRPMPDCLANPDAKTLDDLTGLRPRDAQDVMLHTRTKGNRNQTGHSVLSSVDFDKKQRGIEAFTYSKPAELGDSDMKRIKKLTELEAIVASEPPKKDDPRDSLYFRVSSFLHRITGVWWF